MLKYEIKKIEDGKYRAREEVTAMCFDGDYFKVLSDIVDHAGREKISVEIAKEPEGFPSDSAKRLTQRVIEMHNKLAVIKNTLTQPQLDIIVKD